MARRAPEPTAGAGTAAPAAPPGPARRALRRLVRRPPALVAVGFLGCLALAAVLAPRVSPYPPERIDLDNMSAPPSTAHWLGTDENGRDVLSRVLHGARVSLAVALLSMLIAVALGTLLGGVAGYFGGWADRVISQLVDGMLAIPLFFLWLMVLTSLGPTLAHIVLVLGATGWMPVARVVRSEVLRVRELDYTQAARALGAPEGLILLRHVLPQAVPSVIVGGSLVTAFAILSESALSYLGIGIQPPAPSWGNMLIYHACGVIGVREMGLSPDETEAYIEARQRGILGVRTNVILGLPARYLPMPQVLDAIAGYFGPKQGIGDEWLSLGGLKMVVVNDGWWAYSAEKTRAMILEANRRGWTLCIHINTGGADESTELVLAALEEADRERPVGGRRFCFEHGFGLQKPSQYQRARALGVIIGANPLLAYYAAARSMRMHQIMEQVRIAKMTEADPWKRTVRDWGMPLRDWFEAGVVVTGGSDNPAVVYDPDRPLLGQYSALTGDTLAGVLLPGQELTRERMLQMYTIHNAYAVWQEHIRGSIEVGKLADLVVLDHDILTCPVEQVRDTKVLMTVVGGRVVFERGA